jgi:hypothetical protein
MVSRAELGVFLSCAVVPVCVKTTQRIETSVEDGTRIKTFVGPLPIRVAEGNKDQPKALALVLADSSMPPIPRRSHQLSQTEIATAIGA